MIICTSFLLRTYEERRRHPHTSQGKTHMWGEETRQHKQGVPRIDLTTSRFVTKSFRFSPTHWKFIFVSWKSPRNWNYENHYLFGFLNLTSPCRIWKSSLLQIAFKLNSIKYMNWYVPWNLQPYKFSIRNPYFKSSKESSHLWTLHLLPNML